MLIAVLFNHLGLAEIITFHSKKNVILNCSKCLTFWTTLGYSLFIIEQGVIPSLFYSFTLAYLALWVELLLNVLITITPKVMGKYIKPRTIKQAPPKVINCPNCGK